MLTEEKDIEGCLAHIPFQLLQEFFVQIVTEHLDKGAEQKTPKHFDNPCWLPKQNQVPADGRWTKKITVWFRQSDHPDEQVLPNDCWSDTFTIPSLLTDRGTRNTQNMIRFRYPVRMYQLAAWYKLGRASTEKNMDASHLCGQGICGCFNPEHLVMEPKQTNQERKRCYMVTTCIVCRGNLIGNPCQGHQGSPWRCLRPTDIRNACSCDNQLLALKKQQQQNCN